MLQLNPRNQLLSFHVILLYSFNISRTVRKTAPDDVSDMIVCRAAIYSPMLKGSSPVHFFFPSFISEIKSHKYRIERR